MESICEYKEKFWEGVECEEKKAGYSFGYMHVCMYLYEMCVY